MIRDLSPESEPWARGVDSDIDRLTSGVKSLQSGDDNNHRFITSGMNQLQQRVKLLADLQGTPALQVTPNLDASQVVWTGWVNDPTVQAQTNFMTPTGRVKIDIQGNTWQNPFVVAYSIRGLSNGVMYVDRDYLRGNPGLSTYNSGRRAFLSVIQGDLPIGEVLYIRVEIWTPITVDTNRDGKPALFLTVQSVL